MAIQQISAPPAAVSAVRPTQTAPPPVSVEKPAAINSAAVRRAVEEVRRIVAPLAQDVQFTVDDETGKTVIRVVDSATKEVLRQIPSEEMVEIARTLSRLQGLLLNRRA